MGFYIRQLPYLLVVLFVSKKKYFDTFFGVKPGKFYNKTDFFEAHL